MAPRLALAVFVLALAGATGTARAESPTLTGVVGTNDAYVISLADASGAAVDHLDPGTYTVIVHDRSTLHNFHLVGPGVDVATTVEGVGDQTFTVTVAAGTYAYQCDVHVSQMKRTFTVGTPAAPPPPASSPSVTKLRASLVGSKGVLKGIGGLSAGRARITVADRSKTDGFFLRGPGVAKRTGVAFRGTATWSVTLRAGKYVYGSARHPAARRAFVVSPA